MKQDVLDLIIYNVLLTRMDLSKRIDDLINLETLLSLISKSKKQFEKEPTILRLDAPVWIVGDLHGNIDDLIRIFDRCGYPPSSKYLFLGDYVDRGTASIEVLSLLISLKCKFPDNIFLLRGNHETNLVSHVRGFLAECEKKYTKQLYTEFMNLFNTFPIAAVVNDVTFCVHGGISPDLDIAVLESLPKPDEIAKGSVFSDLLWSDPRVQDEDFLPNKRGCGYYFSEKALEEFLNRNNLQFIIRSHEEQLMGFEWTFAPNNNCLTIFSNSDYCGHNNVGMICSIKKENTSDDLGMDLQFFLPEDEETKSQRRILLPEWLLKKSEQTSLDYSTEIKTFDYLKGISEPILEMPMTVGVAE